MNNNGARNFAIELGREYQAKWIFPLDGNIFIPKKSLKTILKDITKDGFNICYCLWYD